MKFALKKPLANLFLCCSMAPLLASAESLNTVYEKALNNDQTFQAAKATLEAGLQNKVIGRSAILPQVSANASYSDTDGTNKLTNLPSDSWRREYGVTLSQPLFDLKSWYAYKNSDTIASTAEVVFAGEEQSLIIRTATAYFDVLKAYDNLETSRAEEEALSHQLEQTKQRFAVGLTAITEVHEAQAAFDSATATRLGAEGNLGIAFEALEVLTGQAFSHIAPLKDAFVATPPTPNKREEWVNLALEKNTQLLAQKLGLKQQEYAVKTERSAYAPTVYASVGYADTRQSLPIQDTHGDGTSIGVSISVPLFTGGKNTASYKQAQHNLRSTQAQTRQAERDIVQRARSLYLSVITSVATVKARKQAIVSNQSALEATQAGYEVGTRDLVDVLNSQQALYRAERNYHEALYTYILNTLALKEAAGILDTSDISNLSGWLDESKQVKPLSRNIF